MNTKTLLIGAGIGILTLGSLSFAAVTGKLAKGADLAVVKTAVEANNYAALPATAKTKITEAQFSEMVQKSTEHKAVEDALASGNYTAFKAAMVAQVPTEAEFQKMVTAYKNRTESQAKIELAVKNNDFAAFKVAIEAQKAQMAANHPNKNGDAPKAPTDAQLQKHFTTLVEHYKTNGTLPDKMGGPGMGKWMMGEKWMGHGPRGPGQKGE